MGSSDIDNWIRETKESTAGFWNDHVEQPVRVLLLLDFAAFLKYIFLNNLDYSLPTIVISVEQDTFMFLGAFIFSIFYDGAAFDKTEYC